MKTHTWLILPFICAHPIEVSTRANDSVTSRSTSQSDSTKNSNAPSTETTLSQPPAKISPILEIKTRTSHTNSTDNSEASSTQSTLYQLLVKSTLISNNKTSPFLAYKPRPARASQFVANAAVPHCSVRGYEYLRGWCFHLAAGKHNGWNYHRRCIDFIAGVDVSAGSIQFQSDALARERNLAARRFLRQQNVTEALVEIKREEQWQFWEQQVALPFAGLWECFWRFWEGCKCHMLLARTGKFRRQPCSRVVGRTLCGYKYLWESDYLVLAKDRYTYG